MSFRLGLRFDIKFNFSQPLVETSAAMRILRRTLKLILIALVVVVVAVGALMFGYGATPLPLANSPLEFTVRPGSMKSVSQQLQAQGVGRPAFLLTWLARLTRQASMVKAGSYEIQAGVTPLQLLDKLTRGDVTQAEITFIEGWTFRQMREALDRHPDVTHDTAGLGDAQVLARMGSTEIMPEGLFFPNTYLFAKKTSDIEILQRSHRAMQQVMQNEWQQRDQTSPLRNPYEALTLASIVEKETGRAADRSLVASVFINRLRQGMLLQTDPTVIYGLGRSFDGDLRKRDLLTDTPYNTYTRKGLPPTPIAMPGQASIRAALQPARTDFFYFVARGDGSSEFSRNLDDHNRAVARFILKRQTP